MRLRTQITLLIVSSLLSVLFFFSVFTYYTFVRITTKSEIGVLWNAAQTILSLPGIRTPEQWNYTGWLRSSLMPQELIRIIDPHSNIKLQLQTDKELSQIPAQFSTQTFSKTLKTSEALMVYIQIPISDEDQHTIAVLQLGRKLDALDDYLNVLLAVLSFTTAVAALLSLVGGMYFARIILRPIHELAQIMESIQKSGVFKRVVMPPSKRQDELGRLIHTFNAMIGKLETNFFQQRQFLADASHELKTPLTIIESYANLLKRWGGNDAKLREEAIDAIQSEASRLRNLTHTLLSVADPESPSTEDAAAFDLEELVLTTAASLQHAFHRDITCEIRLGQKMMHGHADKIKQLLIILLDNAIKYSDERVIVTLEPDPRDAGIAVLKVIDRGIGIEAAHIPRLFDRFYRVDQARNRSTGGSGLGLAIAQNIARAHRGTISVTSSPGLGTQVTVMLPLG